MMNSRRFPKYCTYRIGCIIEGCSKEFPKYLTCKQKLLYDIDTKKHADWRIKTFGLTKKIEDGNNN